MSRLRLSRTSRRLAGSMSVSQEIMSGATDSSRPMVLFGRSGGENPCLQPKCPIHSDLMNRTILALSCLHPMFVDFAPIGASVGLLSAEFVGKWRLAL